MLLVKFPNKVKKKERMYYFFLDFFFYFSLNFEVFYYEKNITYKITISEIHSNLRTRKVVITTIIKL
jgi:hypothetical protein